MFHNPTRLLAVGAKLKTEEKVVKMTDEKLKNIADEKASDPEEVQSNEEAENDPKDATNKKKKKKKRSKGTRSEFLREDSAHDSVIGLASTMSERCKGYLGYLGRHQRFSSDQRMEMPVNYAEEFFLRLLAR